MTAVVRLNNKNFDTHLEKHNSIVLDFTADWCEPCQSFTPIFEEMAETFPDVLFGQINVGDDPDLAHEFNIRSIPTIVILRYKVAVFIQSGTLSRQELKRLVAEAQALTQEDVQQGQAS